jgi:hypothetical protein
MSDKVRDWEKVYISPDFQTDVTEGYPVSLCWDMAEDEAWLEPNYSLAGEGYDIAHIESLCKKWGEPMCLDWDDFNKLLKGLGDDAYTNAVLSEDEEPDEDFGGMTMQ